MILYDQRFVRSGQFNRLVATGAFFAKCTQGLHRQTRAIFVDKNRQSRQENLRGPGQNYIWSPYDVIISNNNGKTGEQENSTSKR